MLPVLVCLCAGCEAVAVAAGRLWPVMAPDSRDGGRSSGGTALLVLNEAGTGPEVELSEGSVKAVRGLESRLVRREADGAEGSGPDGWSIVLMVCGAHVQDRISM